jgi:hypothetical protein
MAAEASGVGGARQPERIGCFDIFGRKRKGTETHATTEIDDAELARDNTE